MYTIQANPSGPRSIEVSNENLRTIASKYVFGINHPDFETLLDKNETIQLDQYLKN